MCNLYIGFCLTVYDDNFVAAKKQTKGTFVSTHQLQRQKNKKAADMLNTPRKSARLNNLQDKSLQVSEKLNCEQVNSPRRSVRLNQLQVNSPRKSSRIHKNEEVNSRHKSAQVDDGQKVEDDTLNLKAASVKRTLALYNPPNEDEDM